MCLSLVAVLADRSFKLTLLIILTTGRIILADFDDAVYCSMLICCDSKYKDSCISLIYISMAFIDIRQASVPSHANVSPDSDSSHFWIQGSLIPHRR